MARRARIHAIHQGRACFWFETLLQYQRPVLSALFYSAVNAASEAADVLARLEPLRDVFQKNPVIWSVDGTDNSDKYDEKMKLEESYLAAKTAGGHAASALFLLTDRMLKKFKMEIRFNVMSYGPKIRNVPFPKVVGAFADQARHIHEWRNMSDNKSESAAAKIIAALGYSPRDDDSALKFLIGMNLNSYIGYEAYLQAIVKEARGQINRWLNEPEQPHNVQQLTR